VRALELVLVGAAVLAGAAYTAWRLWRAYSGRGCSDCAFTGGRDGACQDCAGSAECRRDGAAGTDSGKHSTPNVQHPTSNDEQEKDADRN
jgi:hypothetical protein